MALSEEARAARNKYLRERYAKSKKVRDAQKAATERYWEKKAKEAIDTENEDGNV